MICFFLWMFSFEDAKVFEAERSVLMWVLFPGTKYHLFLRLFVGRSAGLALSFEAYLMYNHESELL